MKGLMLTVLRPADFPDCTRNGISARHDRLILVGYAKRDDFGRMVVQSLPKGSQVFTADDDLNDAVLLVEASLPGALPHLEPFNAHGKGVWTMFGGNMASGDSRLGELIEDEFNGPRCVHAVTIHDRVENN